MPHEIRILCEGYYDRAFWKGWLDALGAQSAWTPAAEGKSRRPPPLDLERKPIQRGQFGFYSKKSRNLIRVQPCGGKSNVMPVLHEVIQLSETSPVRQIIINIDSDTYAGDIQQDSQTGVSAMAMLKSRYPAATMDGENSRVSLPGLSLDVDFIPWESVGDPHPGVPPNRPWSGWYVSPYLKHFLTVRTLLANGLNRGPHRRRQIRRNMRGHIWPVGTLTTAARHSLSACGGSRWNGPNWKSCFKKRARRRW